MLPVVPFYKFLAKKPEKANKGVNKFSRLKLWVPDTIVFND
jgi:hypothetical protein